MRQTALLKVLELVTFFLKKKKAKIQIILNKNYKLFFFKQQNQVNATHIQSLFWLQK